MTIQRTAPYMPVTGISRYLTGDKSCIFAAWFKANHQGYKKMPSDFNSAKWNMEHTDLMNELVEELEERGCQIFIERQNSFRVESARSGVVVGGTPDIIAVHPDGRTVIYDAKTGQGVAVSHRAGAALHVPSAEGAGWPLARCGVRGSCGIRGRQREAHLRGQRGRCLRLTACGVHAEE